MKLSVVIDVISCHVRKAEGRFSFLRNFYESCVSIVEAVPTEDALTSCLSDDGSCSEEELRRLGNNTSVFNDFRDVAVTSIFKSRK